MIRKLVVAGCCSAAIVLGAAVPAFAHVTVDRATAPQGGEITLGFHWD
jgi:hypothetical protein